MEGYRMKPPVRLLVTDLDNTLFDWLAAWHAAFTAMIEKLVEISGVPRAQLLDEIRVVHQKHGTTEYAFLIEEIPSLRNGNHDATSFAPAVIAYRQARDATLMLYPGVKSTLNYLRKQGVKIVGYTESLGFYSAYRVRKLGLDGILETLYSPPDHDIPANINVTALRHYGADHYQFKYTRHEYTPRGELKPQPHLLLDIISAAGGTPDESIYVGDSLLKDVAMAQDAGVRDVFAAYGQTQHKEQYELLRRVTHWTDRDVEREKQLLQRPPVVPTYVLKESFEELVPLFDYSHQTS